ncbi:MAG TPA: hypothetical protein VLK85_03820 [Ramlibacter sp.]|nr:hypothetical protein [Ramlibacter sp.]
MRLRWTAALWACGMVLGAAAAAAAADGAAYKCGGRAGVTYTDRPCTGGRLVGASEAKPVTRHPAPPQDRARRANRAQLAPEARRECEALEPRLRELASVVRKRGSSVTADEERPLVQGRLRWRELRC